MAETYSIRLSLTRGFEITIILPKNIFKNEFYESITVNKSENPDFWPKLTKFWAIFKTGITSLLFDIFSQIIAFLNPLNEPYPMRFIKTSKILEIVDFIFGWPKYPVAQISIYFGPNIRTLLYQFFSEKLLFF